MHRRELLRLRSIAGVLVSVPAGAPGELSSPGRDWDQLPDWQQQTDADIFEHIEQEHADG